MTPSDFVSALQTKMGDGFTVATHPKTRAEPQFDVFPEPRATDPQGNPYRVTFSVRTTTLAGIDATAPIIGEYAEAIAQNLALQKVRGQAAPEWRE